MVEFDPLTVPPNLTYCIQHKRASKLWDTGGTDEQICECCMRVYVSGSVSLGRE